MALWQLTPAARPDDPWWQGRKQWERVVVRADTSAFARLVAATLDTPGHAREYGQEDPTIGSGFKDEKLYHVAPYAGGDYPADGPDEVLETVEQA